MEAIKNLFSTSFDSLTTIRFADIVDMLIIAIVIYKILRWLRRTNSAKAVRAIIILVLALWLASIFQMSVVTFLLNKLLQLGVLALVVIFQPEIRRFLEKVGSSNFSHLLTRQTFKKETDTAISQTVLAASELSRTRTGALIIFEREIKLDDPIKTGTVINADVTAELLKNIFYPKAPLHDGAVIIRDGQIVGAGCMLPLSTNTNLSRDLGMRHRAGIGMSEQSDAVVVIVSEETGAISVAVDGILKRHLAVETFEKLLRNELLPQTEIKRSFPGKILSGWGNRNGKGSDK